MKATFAFSLISILIPSFLFAHEVPVSPVSIQFHIESTQIRAHISMESDYWMLEVLGLTLPPPPTHWDSRLKETSAQVIDDSIGLAVDGVPLKRKTLECRFVEEPMRLVPPRFEFEAIYEMPKEGESLTGRVQFFKEEYSHYIHAKRPIDQSFVSHLRFSGRSRQKLDLPFERPEFQFELADLRKIPQEYFSETFLSSMRTFVFGSLLPLFCLAVFLSLRPLSVLKKTVALSILIVFVVVLLQLASINNAGKPIVAWAQVAILFSVLLWRGRFDTAKAFACVVVAGQALPSLFAMALIHLPFPLESSVYVRWGMLGAILVSAGACACLCSLVKVIHERTLKKNYGETAGRLFLFDVRALSGFLVFYSVMQMIKFQILK